MNTGALRQLVTLDRPIGTGYQPLDPPTWWCAAVGDVTTTTISLVGRFHPGITTATRVHLKGHVYHVDTLFNREERDVELVLTCHEVFD
jgi:hypothetical protein